MRRSAVCEVMHPSSRRLSRSVSHLRRLALTMSQKLSVLSDNSVSQARGKTGAGQMLPMLGRIGGSTTGLLHECSTDVARHAQLCTKLSSWSVTAIRTSCKLKGNALMGCTCCTISDIVSITISDLLRRCEEWALLAPLIHRGDFTIKLVGIVAVL